MEAAIELIERQGGVVAGIVAICIENTRTGQLLRSKYLCSTSVLPGTDYQFQCDAKYLDFFDDFNWQDVFPNTA